MSYLERVLELGTVLGGSVDETLAPVRAYRARADELNSKLDALRAAGEQQHAKIVAGLAEGELDLAAVPQLQEQSLIWAYDSPASLKVVEAVGLTHRQADAAMRQVAPAVFKACQDVIAAMVAESVNLRKRLPGTVVDEKTAFRSGVREASDIWFRLRQLVDKVWEPAQELAGTLQITRWVPGPEWEGDGVLPVIGNRELLRDPRQFVAMRHPEKLPRNYFGGIPAELKIPAAAAAGCEPGLYSWPEAVRALHRYRNDLGYSRV